MAMFSGSQNLFMNVNIGMEGVEELKKLQKTLEESTSEIHNFSRGAKEAAEALEAQARSAARLNGRLQTLDKLGRKDTLQTEALTSRSRDVNNILGEVDRIQNSKQNISQFNDVLSEAGLVMDETGQIFEDKGGAMNQVMGDNSRIQNRAELLDRVAQGQDKLSARQNFGQNVESAMQRGQASNAAMLAGAEEGMQVLRQQRQGNDRLAQSIRNRTQSVRNAASGMKNAIQNNKAMVKGLQDGMNVLQQHKQQSQQLAQSIRERHGATQNSNEAFGEAFGKHMNLMFAGMALNMVLGGVRRSMMKMTGASKALGVGMKSLLLPTFLALNPIFIEFSNLMINAPPLVKQLSGALFILASALAFVMLIGGQFGLFWQSWGDAIKGAVSGNGVLAKSLGAVKSALLTVAAAAKSALISVFQYVAGAVTSAIASTQAWVAANSALLISLGGLLFTIGSLVLGILLLNRVFKKFGPVVGLLATIIGGVLLAALSPLAAIVFAIFGAFKAVNMIFKKFGKVIGAIATVVVGIIAVIIGVFASVPVAIGLAIGAALAFIWNFKTEIGNAIKGAIDFIAGLPKAFKKFMGNAADTAGNIVDKIVGFFKDLWKDASNYLGKIVDFVTNLGSKITSAVSGAGKWLLDIGEDMIQGLIDGIKNMGNMITNAIAGLMPEKFKKALNEAAKFGGEALNAVTSVLTPNDFILTSDGRMIQPDKNDTIVGFNGDGAIQPGQGGGGTTINVNDPVVREERDIDRIVDEVEKRVDRGTRGRSGGLN